MVTKTAMVIARPEAVRSDLRGVVDKPSQKVAVKLKPADRNGHLLGPGYANRVDFALDGGAGGTGGTVRDLRDGSYEVVADLPAGDKTPDEVYATLWVAGERIFRGPLSQLTKKAR